jgi:hypothetical protein
MRKTRIILELILLILLVITGLLMGFVLTGNITENLDHYSYTKAVCDENNYCEDYIINCKGNELTRLSPTGFSVQHNENWEDPRSDAKLFCN